ncbi:MAG: antitoxin Xre/MbcA/ParS toxin-binding domain-containing protein [Pseudomonadales bacterium]
MESAAEFAAIQGVAVPAAVFADHATFIEATRTGLPGAVVKQAVDALGHRDLFVRLLETTTGNLSRFYRRKALNAYHSEGILDTLRVFSKAIRVFDDPDIACEWLDTRIPALGGQRPITLCDTFEGRDMVQTALRKIEYGELI